MALQHAQQVIEIVRNSAGELPHGFHLLRLAQLDFQVLLLGNVRKQAVGVALFPGLFGDDGAVAPPPPAPIAMLNAILNIVRAASLEQRRVGVLHMAAVLWMHTPEPQRRPLPQHLFRRIAEDVFDLLADEQGIALLIGGPHYLRNILDEPAIMCFVSLQFFCPLYAFAVIVHRYPLYMHIPQMTGCPRGIVPLTFMKTSVCCKV